MKHHRIPLLPCFVLLTIGSLAGCNQGQGAKNAGPGTPVIPVAHPVQRSVVDFVEYTGRTVAVQSVDIKARVTGYLVDMPFKEGSEIKGDDRAPLAVKLVGLMGAALGQGPLLSVGALYPGQYHEGDTLFVIDPRPYQAQLDQAQAQLGLYQAQLKLAIKNYERAIELSKTKGAISQKDIETYLAQQEQAEAALKAAQASLEVYRLNLAFTRVTSPIDGIVGRYNLTAGNLVLQDQTLLTTVVAPDPMYAYFDLDEPTLLRIKVAINEGRIKLAQGGDIPVFVGLQGEDGYPHQGTINFVNNQVNPNTGSILVRGIFPNPRPVGGTRLLAPGMFARVKMPIGQSHPALLVIDRAISSDQGLKYVYVVGADNTVQYRRVTTGALQDDGLRVILDSNDPKEGLKPDDWVVVGGLLQIRQKMKIQPDQVAMPTLEGQGPAADTGRPVPPPAARKK